jgi:hypothetical protein
MPGSGRSYRCKEGRAPGDVSDMQSEGQNSFNIFKAYFSACPIVFKRVMWYGTSDFG